MTPPRVAALSGTPPFLLCFLAGVTPPSLVFGSRPSTMVQARESAPAILEARRSIPGYSFSAGPTSAELTRGGCLQRPRGLQGTRYWQS